MRRLVEALEGWARSKGAHRVTLGVSTGRKTEAVARLYERLGYRRAGVTLVRDLEAGACNPPGKHLHDG